jgi:hypothetical protein
VLLLTPCCFGWLVFVGRLQESYSNDRDEDDEGFMVRQLDVCDNANNEPLRAQSSSNGLAEGEDASSSTPVGTSSPRRMGRQQSQLASK